MHSSSSELRHRGAITQNTADKASEVRHHVCVVSCRVMCIFVYRSCVSCVPKLTMIPTTKPQPQLSDIHLVSFARTHRRTCMVHVCLRENKHPHQKPPSAALLCFSIPCPRAKPPISLQSPKHPPTSTPLVRKQILHRPLHAPARPP